MTYVKAKHGDKVTRSVCRHIVKEHFRASLKEHPELEVIGEPRITSIRYAGEADSKLYATVEFAVEPCFALTSDDLGTVTKFVRDFTDKDIDAEIEARRQAKAEFVPASKDRAVGNYDRATVDLVPLGSNDVPAGPWQHGAELLLADTRLPSGLRDAVCGKKKGDSVIANVSHSGADGRYQVVVTKIEAWAVPGVETLKKDGESISQFRLRIKNEMQESWARRADSAVRRKMIESFVKKQRFSVPETLLEEKLDELVVADLRKWRGEGDFDEQGSRSRNRRRAEEMARWQIVKNRLVKEESLQATETDLAEEYRKIAGPDATFEEAQGDFERQPDFRRKIAETVENRRVLESLRRKFTVVEKSRADIAANCKQ